jgi:hypothetical protein
MSRISGTVSVNDSIHFVKAMHLNDVFNCVEFCLDRLTINLCFRVSMGSDSTKSSLNLLSAAALAHDSTLHSDDFL